MIKGLNDDLKKINKLAFQQKMGFNLGNRLGRLFLNISIQACYGYGYGWLCYG